MGDKRDKWIYHERIVHLRETKMRHTEEKQRLGIEMNIDDHGLILPPPEMRDLSPPRKIGLKGFQPRSNHASGGFFGANVVGENFRSLLDFHPTYIDPDSSLAGAYMARFLAYHRPHWKPEFDYSHLKENYGLKGKYHNIGFIGDTQHFSPDLKIGLELGWKGLLQKCQHYRTLNTRSSEFYDGLEDVIIGLQKWIDRHARTAHRLAKTENNPQIRRNLHKIAQICQQISQNPPRTFREACQWILFFQLAAKMYDNSGAIGRLDEYLYPYYKQDKESGILTDEEAVFHLACFLVADTPYIQLGGPDASGKDTTNQVSFLILEAIHLLKTPANIGVYIHEGLDRELLHKALAMLIEDKNGVPKFICGDALIKGFVQNGYPIELARRRVYTGCHWLSIPGREYPFADLIKLNLAGVFDVALREMMSDTTVKPTMKELWCRFTQNLHQNIEATAEGIDFHMRHMHDVFPDLLLDLLCYGPVEKGLNITKDGVEFYNICVDGAGLATVADSFAAIEQRIEKEKRLTWSELIKHLDNNYEDEKVRLMMSNIPKYGKGETRADYWAKQISKTLTRLVKENPTPDGFNMIPGLFSWVSHLSMGRMTGATPNGRLAHTPLSQGANPDPGFIEGSRSPTALAIAVANVQSGYGNTTPLQLEIDGNMLRDEEGIKVLEGLILGHSAMGGTLININILDKKQIIEAHKNPSQYPNLIVRVTGFSAYFASLSHDLRQLVVDRILSAS